jgi:lysozyme family protein
MTRRQAKRIYRRQFWSRYDYGLLFSAGGKIFDLAVNMGPGNAHRVLQRACRACGHKVKVDGFLGPITIAAANSCPREAIHAACREAAAGYYRGLVLLRPAFGKYLEGWLARAYF